MAAMAAQAGRMHVLSPSMAAGTECSPPSLRERNLATVCGQGSSWVATSAACTAQQRRFHRSPAFCGNCVASPDALAHRSTATVSARLVRDEHGAYVQQQPSSSCMVFCAGAKDGGRKVASSRRWPGEDSLWSSSSLSSSSSSSSFSRIGVVRAAATKLSMMGSGGKQDDEERKVISTLAAEEEKPLTKKKGERRRATTKATATDMEATKPVEEEAPKEAEGKVTSLTMDDVKAAERGMDKRPHVPLSSTFQRKTKIVCTIGPTSNSREMIWQLVDAGMNVARLNMSHGEHQWHRAVVDLIKEYNAQPGVDNVAIMLDTKGPEVRTGDVHEPILLTMGQEFTFTIKRGVVDEKCVSVNYDGFVDDVEIEDIVLIDGGMQSLAVKSKTKDSVICEVVDGGYLTSRRHLNVRGKSATLPSITEKDWEDIKFGVDNGVDYYALSFVKSADVVHELKDYLKSKNADIKVLVKIESADSIPNLHTILEASDGAMVARGDLGAELPVEEVPILQNQIIQICRSMVKPVIVATNMLESMINHPTPTRAEVSDIAIAVREGTDAVMLSGETAHGKYPLKAVKVMHTVALQTEATLAESSQSSQGPFVRQDSGQAHRLGPVELLIKQLPSKRMADLNYERELYADRMEKNHMSEMFAFHATMMANTLGASVLVFSRSGSMAHLLSHYRPQGIIFTFTNDKRVQRRLALYNGVRALYMEFSADAEVTFKKALAMLVEYGMVEPGEEVALVQSGRTPIWRSESTHHIQVRTVQ
ncbi:hypothetical protein CBR_g22263 [Chara braunii]|uniref:Pyruvate kinase n=1 Tax=Chara braunii TaxID=69332 RepID=A0A388L2I1_CHABU|nr:hypothetical protein CBR_g22263 [Chara braunii]|eukprot:GBG76515.1 hypothetical protein CBR_g22263 [Chara braunii]